MHSRTVLACSLALSCAAISCTSSTKSPCDGIECSSHGVCAVRNNITPLCICDVGFSSTSAPDCQAVAAGAECSNVACSGHGACVVVDGTPKTPLCVCEAGYELVGSTTCVEKDGNPCTGHMCPGSDPCAAVSCGPGGTCVVRNQTVAMCLCPAGFHADGASCVPDASRVDGGSAFLLMPSQLAFSGKGSYASFVSLRASDAGPTTFDVDRWVIRKLDAGTDVVIDPSPQITCGSSGCALMVMGEFDEAETRLFVRGASSGPQSNYSGGTFINVDTGARTSATQLSWLERFSNLAPDFSWAVVTKQSYMGSGGALAFASPLTAAPTQFATSCNDIGFGHVDAYPADGGAQIAYWTCTAGAGFTLRQISRPTGTAVSITTAGISSVSSTYARPGFVTYTSNLSTFAVPTSPSSTAMLVGAGFLVERSPDRRWALLKQTNQSAELLDLDSPFATRLSLGIVEAVAWSAPATLYVLGLDGSLRSSVAGAALQTLAASGSFREGSTLFGVAGGVVLVDPPGTGFVTLKIQTGANSMSLIVPTEVRATFFGPSVATDLGTGNHWKFGGRAYGRSKFYFDVLRNNAPDPNNRVELLMLP